MAVMKQGENFDEAPIKDQNGNKVDMPVNEVPEQQPTSSGPKLPFGLNIKTVGIAIGAIAVIVFGIMIFSPKSPTTLEDAVSTSDSTLAVTQETTAPAPPDPSTNEYGELLAEGSGEEIVDPYAFLIYTEDEVQFLREMGYTGDEIEYNSQQGTPYDDLMTQAQEARDTQYETWRKSVLDASSDEFKELMSKTFLDGEDTAKPKIKSEDMNERKTIKENVDYVKSGCFNYRCWIKVELSTGSTVMCLPLDRYNELPDSGNLLVQYSRISDSNGKVLYIDDLKELSF